MRGRIEVITGGMYAGKSEALASRLTRAKIGRKSVAAFKHAKDDRFHKMDIASHSGGRFEGRAYQTVRGMATAARGAEVIGIDEAQFFDEVGATGEYEIVQFAEEFANMGCRVILACLDLTAEGKPFGPTPFLMAVADAVEKKDAVCMVCGEPAYRSFFKGVKLTDVVVGAAEYEARCRPCWVTGRRDQFKP